MEETVINGNDISKSRWKDSAVSTPTNNIDTDSESLNEQIRQQRYKQDTALRLSLSTWVKWVVVGWLGCVMSILFCCGLGWMRIPSTVLHVLLATTTINVLGLAYIVLRGIFK